MPESFFGLPTHAIVVHATVVLVPLASLVVLLHALWPEARRRLGVVTPLMALVALVLVPLSTSSGEELEHQVRETALVERHAQLADGLLPWVLVLFAVAVGLWLLDRRRSGPAGAGPAGLPRWVPLATSVLAVVAVAGTVQQVVRVGHAGAEATWSDVSGVAGGQPSGGDPDGD